ncbi:MAG: Gfo/Idh/MocA family oxidoreductase [Clostridia bacterium]|nr:Gfo/Idh/MocA family oxidoreductase [Clostridia bacterium]
MMKALFIGLGSIGNRHSKNLRDICEKRGIPLSITALRSQHGSLRNKEFPQVDRMITELDEESYDLAFITNPTTLHAEAFQKVREKAKFFFVEKPVFADTSMTPEQIGMDDSNVYVAAPMRFCKTYAQLKKEVSMNNVFAVRILCSSYLPDWRPQQDYRQVYSARKELGGGVAIDLIHEVDYMVDLFGFSEDCFMIRGHYSPLEINTDDLCLLIARYADKAVEVHLDYFGRTYRRTCECFCEDGSIVADFGAGTVTRPDGTVIHCEEPVNERYIQEMERFIDFAQGKATNANPPSLAYKVLRLALEAET